jgi:hypothetical protein
MHLLLYLANKKARTEPRKDVETGRSEEQPEPTTTHQMEEKGASISLEVEGKQSHVFSLSN